MFGYKACVTCYDNGGTTYIRVQSNNLPNHCYGSGVPNPNYPIETTVEWTSVWNPSVIGQKNYSEERFATVEASEEELFADKT